MFSVGYETSWNTEGMTSKEAMEPYAIAQIEQVKHLQQKFTEYELISKLSYHSDRNI